MHDPRTMDHRQSVSKALRNFRRQFRPIVIDGITVDVLKQQTMQRFIR